MLVGQFVDVVGEAVVVTDVVGVLVVPFAVVVPVPVFVPVPVVVAVEVVVPPDVVASAAHFVYALFLAESTAAPKMPSPTCCLMSESGSLGSVGASVACAHATLATS